MLKDLLGIFLVIGLPIVIVYALLKSAERPRHLSE
jgi:hypothetical protein